MVGEGRPSTSLPAAWAAFDQALRAFRTTQAGSSAADGLVAGLAEHREAGIHRIPRIFLRARLGMGDRHAIAARVEIDIHHAALAAVLPDLGGIVETNQPGLAEPLLQ